MEEEQEDFPVTAPAVDAEALTARIRETVRRKRERGDYEGINLSGVASIDYEKELNDEEKLLYHLQVTERLSDVNYGDYEIVSKGGVGGKLEVLLKKVIWKLLRFYTYRLFSQQREFDCQVSEALASHYRWSRGEIDRLSGEIDALRARLDEGEKRTGS